MSLEAASSLRNRTFENLYIDEATMMNFTSLIPLFKNKIGKVHLYGDKSQIGVKDMSMTDGTRPPASLYT